MHNGSCSFGVEELVQWFVLALQHAQALRVCSVSSLRQVFEPREGHLNNKRFFDVFSFMSLSTCAWLCFFGLLRTINWAPLGLVVGAIISLTPVQGSLGHSHPAVSCAKILFSYLSFTQDLV